MFTRFVTKIQSVAANVIAWQINRNHERWATRLLEQIHTGASLDWINDIIEVRGRHALAVVHYHH